jgi:hypothetical protein
MSPSIHEIPALTARQIRLQDPVFCFHPLLSLVLPSCFDIPLAIFSSENHGFYYIESLLYFHLYLGNMGSNEAGCLTLNVSLTRLRLDELVSDLADVPDVCSIEQRARP